jgi:predicted DNA-binding transcriptional regulator YafY
VSVKPVVIDYTNHRGERRERMIIPHAGSLRFAETPDHTPAQWVFNATDVEKGATRTFALANVHSWRPL